MLVLYKLWVSRNNVPKMVSIVCPGFFVYVFISFSVCSPIQKLEIHLYLSTDEPWNRSDDSTSDFMRNPSGQCIFARWSISVSEVAF